MRYLIPVLGAPYPESVQTKTLTRRNCESIPEGGHEKSVMYFRGAVKDAKTVLGNYQNLLTAIGLDEEQQRIDIESLRQSVKSKSGL